MHEIRREWCEGEKEWEDTKEVQRVLGRLKWGKAEDEEGGITWIELFAIYVIHGGSEKERKEMGNDPLRKPQMMQKQIAEFKKAVRRIKKHTLSEGQEWLLAHFRHRQQQAPARCGGEQASCHQGPTGAGR